MQMDDENRERVLRFLLDDLGPEERAGVEERCFTDDEFFLAVEAQEEQTLRDYLVGGLSPAQRRLFESRYFATPAMRRRLDDTQRAILAVGRAGRGLAAAQPSLSRRVGKWVRPRSPGGGFVYAAVGVVVVASLGV